MKNTADNEKLYAAAGPGHWNDPDMLITGMEGLSEAQNRSFFSLWCMMASPLMAGNNLLKMTASTIQILTNREAIAINQDPLGIQGRIVRREGQAEIWAGKRLFDGSQAVLVFNSGTTPAEVHVTWPDIGSVDSASLYVRNLWTHRTTGPQRGGIAVTVPPNDAAMLRISKSNGFPLPPVIVADSYWLSFHAPGPGPQKLAGAITVRPSAAMDCRSGKCAPAFHPGYLSRSRNTARARRWPTRSQQRDLRRASITPSCAPTTSNRSRASRCPLSITTLTWKSAAVRPIEIGSRTRLLSHLTEAFAVRTTAAWAACARNLWGARDYSRHGESNQKTMSGKILRHHGIPDSQAAR